MMIGLMDCNNFFVSCERLFRPDLLKKPVIVLSSNDGCVVSRSQEVKDMGIPMGIPFFQIKDICKKQGISVFSSNFALYRDISHRVMTVLKDMHPDRAIYSIDEAFFTIPEGITNTELLAQKVRILKETGIPVSFGIAPSKTLAKAVNVVAKKGTGVCIFNQEVWENHVQSMSCGSIWGIGRETTKLLASVGITTVADLMSKDRSFIQKLLGVPGERLFFELQGKSVFSLGDVPDSIQGSYTSTRSFGVPVRTKATLFSALSYHLERVSEKLRSDHVMAHTLTIIARGSRYGDFAHRVSSASVLLETPTQQTIPLLRAAGELLDTLYDPEIPYKKAGVVVGGIVPKDAITKTLFSAPEDIKNDDTLDGVTDTLNRRYGIGTLTHGCSLGRKKWQASYEHISPEYTTNWGEIVTVKAT